MNISRDHQSSKVFTRRAIVIGALQMCFLGGLGVRLAWLQISQGQRYKTLSDKNRINMKMLAPSRGQIVDRFGVPLAVNSQNFRVLVIPEQADNLKNVLRGLKELIELSEDQIQDTLKRARKSSSFLPLAVKDDLTWEEVAKVEVNLPDLPGLSIDVGELRSYPYGNATAHVVGYVGLPSKGELTDDKALNLPGFKIGKTGIEKSLDEELRGKTGASQVEVNVVGREVRELNRQKSSSGARAVLTIDAELQRFTQARLEKEKSASAVIMDVHTGAVYALASHPSFDSNMFTHGLSAAAWEELLADPGYPLTNKAIAGQYPPASTFKMITALAGMQAGRISEARTVYCPGHYDYGGDRFHCWRAGGHGNVNMVEALQKSCDTYFYEVATEIGIDKIAEVARAFGLGSKLDFDLKEENPGLVPDKNWKMGYHGGTWRPGETIVSSIGQGYLQSTPLQLAVMTSRLVNGGRAVKPWITAYLDDQKQFQESWPEMNLDQWHLKLIKRGMDRVVNHEKGTAYKSRIENSAIAMGGKTGTAQVQRITKAQRAAGVKNEDLAWRSRHHALFVGYAPLKNPRYVCSVVVEHGGGGSSAAAPIAKDLLIEAQKRNPADAVIQAEATVNAGKLKPSIQKGQN